MTRILKLQRLSANANELAGGAESTSSNQNCTCSTTSALNCG